MSAGILMEKHPRDLPTTVSSKHGGIRTGFTHVSSTRTVELYPIQEHYIRSAHVYNCFPKGQPIRKPIASSRRSRSSVENFNSSLVLINQRLPLYTERTMHLYMPRLTFNHTADTSLNSRSTNCSFVTNNKLYMKKKGLNINHLYSFKQSKRGINDWKILPENLNAKTKPFPVSCENSSILQLNNSRQAVTGSPMYVELMRGLEREAKIPGHVRAADCTGNRLGKVLTKTHLESLLTQEQPVIPPAFYITS